MSHVRTVHTLILGAAMLVVSLLHLTIDMLHLYSFKSNVRYTRYFQAAQARSVSQPLKSESAKLPSDGGLLTTADKRAFDSLDMSHNGEFWSKRSSFDQLSPDIAFITQQKRSFDRLNVPGDFWEKKKRSFDRVNPLGELWAKKKRSFDRIDPNWTGWY